MVPGTYPKFFSNLTVLNQFLVCAYRILSVNLVQDGKLCRQVSSEFDFCLRFFFLGGVGVKPVDSSEVIVGVSYGACALSRGFLVV
jgi:hypothetical protein